MTIRYTGSDSFLTRSSLGVVWSLGMLWGIATMATGAAAARFVLPPLVQLAGSVHQEGYPDRGRQALIADPQRAVAAPHSASRPAAPSRAMASQPSRT
jgi:hypothetical protein